MLFTFRSINHVIIVIFFVSANTIWRHASRGSGVGYCVTKVHKGLFINYITELGERGFPFLSWNVKAGEGGWENHYLTVRSGICTFLVSTQYRSPRFFIFYKKSFLSFLSVLISAGGGGITICYVIWEGDGIFVSKCHIVSIARFSLYVSMLKS